MSGLYGARGAGVSPVARPVPGEDGSVLRPWVRVAASYDVAVALLPPGYEGALAIVEVDGRRSLLRYVSGDWEEEQIPELVFDPPSLDLGDTIAGSVDVTNRSTSRYACLASYAASTGFAVTTAGPTVLAPEASSAIAVRATAAGEQTGTVTAQTSDGPRTFAVASAYTYLPAVIPGYLADYDAQFQAVVADNTTLTSVLDRSGNAYHTTGVTQTPKYRSGANGINNFPCFRFDSGSDNAFFSLPAAIRSAIGTAGQGEYIAVVTATASANCGEPLGIGNRPSSGGLYPLSANGFYSAFVAQNQRNLGTIGVSPITNPHVMGISHSGTALFSYTNGSQRGTVSDTLTAGTSFCQFPDRYNNTTSYKGKIGQLIIFARRLTSDERTAVVDFLKARWGIA